MIEYNKMLIRYLCTINSINFIIIVMTIKRHSQISNCETVKITHGRLNNVIVKILLILQNFCFTQSDKFFVQNFFTSNIIYGEYMAHIDMNKHIVT